MHEPAVGRDVCTAVLLIASALGTGTAWPYTAPYSTPPGITLVDVSKLMDAGSPQFLWRRLGDTNGNPLYAYDADQAGKSSCYGECAREFPPYRASPHDKAFGDWSIIRRDDQVRQWAYQGKPLYRYSGEDPIGEPQGGRFQLIENPAWHDPASAMYSPKQGWRRAAYLPERSLLMPSSVELDCLPIANGFGWVDAATHRTLYAAALSRQLSGDWHPLRAAALAVPLGEFSIIRRRQDGTRQWTYRGEALYTYAGDAAAGYANGLFTADQSIQVALAYRNFIPSGVTIGNYVGRGPLMTTSKGQTLYFIARYHATYGGLEAPGEYSVSYNELKSQGTIACRGDCTGTWVPIMAPKDARAWGFWELVDRPEGKQWAYKGSAVYSYVGDHRPGDTEGNNRNVILFGGPDGQIVYADAGSDLKGPAPHLGTVDMIAATGSKPGEEGAYVAGDGYTGAPTDKDYTFIPTGRARAQGSSNSQAQGQERAARRRQGPGDHGAGFYWHTVSLF